MDVSFSSLEELNERLLDWCENVANKRVLERIEFIGGANTPEARWSIEAPIVQTRPIVATDCYMVYETTRKVNKFGFIRVDNFLYRVPDCCRSRTVSLKIVDGYITVMLKDEVIITLNKAKDYYTPKQCLAEELNARVIANKQQQAFDQRLKELETDADWVVHQAQSNSLGRTKSVYDDVFFRTGGTS